jgi:hypothetical protein
LRRPSRRSCRNGKGLGSAGGKSRQSTCRIRDGAETHLEHRLDTKVRVDTVRTISDKNANVVNLLRLARLNDNRDFPALLLAHEVVVYTSSSDGGRDRNTVRPNSAVGEDEDTNTLDGGLERFVADAGKGGFVAGDTFRLIEGRVDGARLPGGVGAAEVFEDGRLFDREDGRGEEETSALRGALFEEVGASADCGRELMSEEEEEEEEEETTNRRPRDSSR